MAKLQPTISAHRSSTDAPPPGPPSNDGSVAERVARVIDLIRPAVQADGGDVEFIDITDDHHARIRLHGACVGCPSAAVTLQLGIERNLKEYVPEIRGVRAVD